MRDSAGWVFFFFFSSVPGSADLVEVYLMRLWSDKLAGAGRFLLDSAGMTGRALCVVAPGLVHTVIMGFEYERRGEP